MEQKDYEKKLPEISEIPEIPEIIRIPVTILNKSEKFISFLNDYVLISKKQ